jgi:ATP-dependent DNA helicase RecG
LDIHSLGDMLYYFPRRYDDYTQLKPINRLFYGQEVTVIATVQSINARPIRGGRQQMVEVIVNDGSGALRVNWFNQPWIGRRLREGMHVVLSGKVEQYLGRLVMNNPEVEQLEQQSLHTNRIVPVYSLTANITQHWLRRMMFQVVSYWAPRVQDYLPEGVRRSADLIDLPNALLQVHFPDSQERLHAARERLAFDEIFLLQLGVLRQKRTWQSRTARVFETTSDWLDEQVGCLPFTLTSAQQHALADVRADLASGHPMNRLLQGDVGSGKTVIAALAIAMLARHGAQSAILAPTSILAEQHYLNLQKLLTEKSKPDSATQPALQPNEIVLLTGATPEPEKNDTRERLASGEIKLVVGTHALIEDPITFSDLQLAIIDEQHRFGVEQRAALRRKGDNPHLLVMTATPIPRSLALTVYGDLDLSLMDEMPPGRQLVETHVLLPRERERAYSLIHNQVEKNYQAFIIYPLIEEGETEEAQPAGHGAVEEHARLQSQVFPNHVLGLLHGRLKADEKEAVMAGFRDREIDVLVSTSVVEVGVDIVNATVMLVEGANRFGLAQLHQFRGRVGRGEAQAYCLLIPETADHAENERLSAMVETNDGFILAERDLEQRGPGEFLGTRQSGYHSELRMASLTDIRLIEKARRQAQAIFEADPDLEGAEHQSLAAAVEAYWGIKEQMTQGDIS